MTNVGSPESYFESQSIATLQQCLQLEDGELDHDIDRLNDGMNFELATNGSKCN